MLSGTSTAPAPDRDNLPLKKRDQRWSSPPSLQHQQQCDAETFKVPYPHRSCAESRFKHVSPFRPFPKRVPSLHQPWIHTYTPTGSVPQVVSAFRAHRGWNGWSESKPPCLGWERVHAFQHHGHRLSLLQAGQHRPRFSTASGIGGGFQSTGDREPVRGRDFNTQWKVDERNGGPYLKRSRKTESLPHAGHPSLSTRSPQQVLQTQPSAKPFGNPTSGYSFTKYGEFGDTYVAMREVASGSPPPGSQSPNRLPWLLPHFLAGSLIELRDGRLRRVEHLQTEDFLLGALACPDLRLSCCTVQSITPSASSSISRLLILLHDQQTQELVDVYVEYPFFVQDHGWSSCSPQRTARLCGLQCRQLCIGDVCLALTPLSAPQRPLTTEPRPQIHVPPGPGQPAGQQKEVIRRRHRSAPELRRARTECAS